MEARLIGSQQSGRWGGELFYGVGGFCSLPLEVLPFSHPINVPWLLNYSRTEQWSWVPSWSECR